jgi:hypothetical protein
MTRTYLDRLKELKAAQAMNAPTLLLHLLRQGAELSNEGNDLVIGGSDSARFMPLIRGRAYELIGLLGSRADWLADINARAGT